MRERCTQHGLAVGEDGCCVLCRRSQPAPTPAAERSLPWPRLLAWLLVLGLAIGALVYVRGSETAEHTSAVQAAWPASLAAVAPSRGAVTDAQIAQMTSEQTANAERATGAAAPSLVAASTEPSQAELDDPVRAIVKLIDRHPLGAPRVLVRRGGDHDGTSYAPGEETFSLFVPASFVSDGSWGVLVWVAAHGNGKVPRPDWEAVLARHHLIWAGGNRTGNRREVSDRIGIALDALQAVQTRMHLDPRRVIIGGMSGGAKTALRTQLLYPDLFAGALPVCGADFYRALPASRGGHYPARGHAPLHLDAAQRRPIVMVTGTHDFNLDHVSVVADAMRADGFARVQVDVVEGLGHHVPDATGFERALATLLREVDGR